MSDIIDINQLRNKVSEKDINEFREFIFGLYDKLAEGKLFIGDISEQMDKYANKKGIAEEKLSDYGVTREDIPRLAQNSHHAMGFLYDLTPVELNEEDTAEIFKRAFA